MFQKVWVNPRLFDSGYAKMRLHLAKKGASLLPCKHYGVLMECLIVPSEPTLQKDAIYFWEYAVSFLEGSVEQG